MSGLSLFSNKLAPYVPSPRTLIGWLIDWFNEVNIFIK